MIERIETMVWFASNFIASSDRSPSVAPVVPQQNIPGAAGSALASAVRLSWRAVQLYSRPRGDLLDALEPRLIGLDVPAVCSGSPRTTCGSAPTMVTELKSVSACVLPLRFLEAFLALFTLRTRCATGLPTRSQVGLVLSSNQRHHRQRAEDPHHPRDRHGDRWLPADAYCTRCRAAPRPKCPPEVPMESECAPPRARMRNRPQARRRNAWFANMVRRGTVGMAMMAPYPLVGWRGS